MPDPTVLSLEFETTLQGNPPVIDSLEFETTLQGNPPVVNSLEFEATIKEIKIFKERRKDMLSGFEQKYLTNTSTEYDELTGPISEETPYLLLSGTANKRLALGLIEFTGIVTPSNIKLYSYDGIEYSLIKEYLSVEGSIRDDCDIVLPEGSGLYLSINFNGSFFYYLKYIRI